MKTNRIIKFRVWDKNKNEFLFGKESFTISELNVACVIDSHFREKICDIPDNVIFQQFTDLQDSKGRDIYEGDILKDSSPSTAIYVCKWSISAASSRFKMEHTNQKWDFGGETKTYLEIIGNIFENPELLNISSGSK